MCRLEGRGGEERKRKEEIGGDDTITFGIDFLLVQRDDASCKVRYVSLNSSSI